MKFYWTRYVPQHIFLILLSIFAGNLMVYAGDVSTTDIVAGYKYNASQFYKARICYKMVISFDKRFLSSSSTNIDWSSVELINPTFIIDYWTNQKDLLIRGGEASSNEEEEILRGATSENNLSTTDFETRYRNSRIFSYFAEDKTVRFWMGYNAIDQSPKDKGKSVETVPSAILDSTIPIINDPDFSFPPFLPFSYENKENLFPTDSFFEEPFKEARLLGTTVVGNETLYVLENRVTMPKEFSDLSKVIEGTKYENSDIRVNYIYKAWVNLEKGCIPVRIEKSSHFSIDNDLVGYKDSLDFNEVSAEELFEAYEIKEIGSDLFLPVKASLKFFTAPPDSDSPVSSTPILDILNGKGPSDELIVCEKKTWEILHVEPNVEISETTLKLPFPKGTELFDMRTKRAGIVGMTEKEYEDMLRAEEAKAGAYDFDSGFVLPDPDAKWKADDYIPRAPQGYRRAFFIIGVNLIIIALVIRHFMIRWKNRLK